ncbi:MAG: hypothetical protein H6707_10420 [Deltaproteobacteria bacterium]|nr:hypothetical protein [Deltaproteobacteria bacterium]
MFANIRSGQLLCVIALLACGVAARAEGLAPKRSYARARAEAKRLYPFAKTISLRQIKRSSRALDYRLSVDGEAVDKKIRVAEDRVLVFSTAGYAPLRLAERETFVAPGLRWSFIRDRQGQPKQIIHTRGSELISLRIANRHATFEFIPGGKNQDVVSGTLFERHAGLAYQGLPALSFSSGSTLDLPAAAQKQLAQQLLAALNRIDKHDATLTFNIPFAMTDPLRVLLVEGDKQTEYVCLGPIGGC